jgi:hypothetical protein
VLETTRDILAQIAQTPMGRKASMRTAHALYASLEATYGEEFLKLAMKE